MPAAASVIATPTKMPMRIAYMRGAVIGFDTICSTSQRCRVRHPAPVAERSGDSPQSSTTPAPCERRSTVRSERSERWAAADDHRLLPHVDEHLRPAPDRDPAAGRPAPSLQQDLDSVGTGTYT